MAGIIKALFQVDVKSKGLGKAKGDVDALGKSTQNLGGAHKDAEKAANAHYNTQAKGVIGTANSSKSFSKLAQTMNSGGGVVGAYATLAANIFAVSAAFNALRAAAQTQQLEKGLEALGARTGQTLTVAAQGLREITNNTISMEQAMRSSAQVFSAGFNSKDLENIGAVANDVSVALGRNMTDSMDRLTRGIIKLEPELLDELGLMTRLGESSRLYAIQLGKTESSLSTTEKRMGFMNAILEEGRLKFGGLSDAAGNTRAYDTLAAAMSDLSKATLNFVNGALLPLVNVFANNPGLIGGAALLFVSSLRNQLLPGMAELEERSKKMSENMAKNATKASDIAIKAAATASEAEQDAFDKRAVMATEISGRGLTKELKGYNKFVHTADLKDYEGAVRSLDSAIIKQDEKMSKVADKTTEAYANQVDKLDELKKAKLDIVKYSREEVLQSERVVAANREAAKTKRIADSASLKAQSRDSLGNAYGAISDGKIKEAMSSLNTSITQYATATRIGTVNTGIFATSLGTVRIAAFAATASLKVLGAAFLTALPYLGLVVVAIGLIVSAFKSFESAEKKLENKKAKEFGEVYGALGDKLKELERVNNSNTSAALRTQSALTIELNAVIELAEKYRELQEAKAASAKVDERGGENPDRVARWWETWTTKSARSNAMQVSMDSAALNLSNDTGLVQALDSLSRTAPVAFDELMKVNGGAATFKKLDEAVKRSKTADALDAQAESALEAKSAMDAFTTSNKEANDALVEFSRAALPKTAFDKSVQGLQSLNKAIVTLRENARLSATEKMDILSGISDGVRNNLTFSATKFLDDTAAVASLEKQLELTRTLTSEQRTVLDRARERLQTSGYTEESLVAEISKMEELAVQAQESAIIAQSQNTILTARMKINQNNYNLTVVGLKKQMEGENAIIAGQIRQVQVQKNLLDGQIVQRNNRIADMQASLEQLDIDKARTAEQLKQNILWSQGAVERLKLEQAVASAANNGFLVATKGADILRINTRLQADETRLSGLDAETAEQRLSIERSITAVRQENRVATLASQTLANDIAALAMQTLNAEQQAARIREREVEINNARAAQAEEARKVLEDVEAIERRRNILIARGTLSLGDQLEAEAKIAMNARNARIAQHAAEKARMEAARNKAASDGNDREAQTAAVAHWNEEIRYADTLHNAYLVLEETTANLAILEQVLFDTRVKGIEQQKEAITLLQQQATIENERAASVNELARAQDNLERRRGNYAERGRAGQEAEAIRAAREAFEQARNEVSIKKTLIDMEFELLEAKDETLKAELMVARTQLALLNGNGEFSTHIAQLDRTMQILERVDREGSRVAQRQTLDNQVAVLGKNLEATMTPYTGSRNSNTRDREDLRTQRELARTALQAQETAGEDFISGSTAVVNSMLDVSSALAATIAPLTATYREPVATNGYTSRHADPSVLAGLVAEEFVRRNPSMSYWQHSSSDSGPASRRDDNSYHNIDQAADINSRNTRVEWDSPETRALIQREVQVLRETYGEALAESIFNSTDHKDHLHIAFRRGFVEPIVAAVTTARSETVSAIAAVSEEPVPIDDIVVTANRRATPVPTPAASIVAANDNNALSMSVEIMQRLEGDAKDLMSIFSQLGPQGEVMNIMISGISAFGDELEVVLARMKDPDASINDKFQAIAGAALSALSTVQGALRAASDAKVEMVDKEIAAEQKRDGKSAESIAKIQSLERKKDAIQRKAFETNKKVQMAQSIIATASGVAQALTLPFPMNFVMAGIIGAMGAAQLAIISGTSYQSTSAPGTQAATMPASLSIGKRGDSVDVAKNNVNAGGEIGYLRGTQGRGRNASNYAVIGSAYGGRTPRGYGNTAFMVGENGPEIMTPDTPMTVRPVNDNAQSAQPISATFQIQALDASGVEEILHGQRGNIISMLRDAANANGQTFLEDVNTAVYTKPNVSRL